MDLTPLWIVKLQLSLLQKSQLQSLQLLQLLMLLVQPLQRFTMLLPWVSPMPVKRIKGP
jgi:hypothetical protein